MWAELEHHLPGFPTAVLTARDPAGYPFSVRCRPLLDRTARLVRLELAPGLPLQPGPASLLCHRHDEQLWSQRSFLVRGQLERPADGWAFRPVQFVPGAGLGGIRGLFGFVFGSRRAAARYLRARGLARPRVPWDEIEAIKAEVERDERQEARR